MQKEKTARVVKYILKKFGGKLEGRKKLQKLVYFIDALHSLPEIDFFMGLYGPYSKELDDLVVGEGDSYGISSKLEDRGEYLITEISLVDKRKDIHLEEELKKVVDKVLSDFGKLNASSLELYSSVHFVAVVTGKRDPLEIKKILHTLKPSKFYTEEEIKKALKFLRERGYIDHE